MAEIDPQMPDYLQKAARANLAAQDASITNVNAAGANAITQTDPRQVQGFGAAPTVAPVVNPNQMLDSAIENRRNALAQGLANGVNPDAPAMFVDPQTRLQMNHELGQLTDIAHRNAEDRAAQAHLSLIQQRDIEVRNGAANIFNGLKQIPLDGSPESDAAAHDLVQKNRIAFDNSKEVQQEVLNHYRAHLGAASARAALGSGMQVDHTVVGNDGKSHTVYKPVPDAAETEGAQFYVSKEAALQDNPGATVDQTKDGWRVSRFTDKNTSARTNPALLKVVSDIAAIQAQKDATYNKDKGANLTTFDTQLAAANAKAAAIRAELGQSATPSATPVDMKALAQKALQDPNASEEHKKAARKLLGQ